jgi:hypothetical protein
MRCTVRSRLGGSHRSGGIETGNRWKLNDNINGGSDRAIKTGELSGG